MEDRYDGLQNEETYSKIRLLLDEDCTILRASDSFNRGAGYGNEEDPARFRSMRQYYAQFPEDFAAMQKELHRAAEDRQETVLTLRRPRKSGFGWIRISAGMAGRTEDGIPIIDGICTDVSDLVFQKEEKAHSFEWMMDEYDGNIYISDMETYELLYLNATSYDSLYETVHLTPDRILGRKCYEVIQGRTSPCPFCTNPLLNEEEFYEWEFFNPNLNRTFMIKNRIINWNGHRARIELSHDMYSVEYKLAKKEREREALLRTIPGGFARIDARDCCTILWYGAEFLHLIGYTKKQFETELHSQCTYMYPQDLERRKQIMEEIRRTGESAVFESHITTHEGKTRILTMSLCYVSAEDSWDGIPSFYSVGIDVTKERAEQERQQKALEEAYQAARVANAAKTNFLSSMSHDIRTPMNAITGMAAIAQANLQSPDRMRDCLNKIILSSRHLLSLINEVLDMSKIESGKIDLTLENVDLPALVQNVADMCRPLITEKHHEFRINVGRVQHEKVVADGDRLQQVLMNLLSNAIKYTPAYGTICFTIDEAPSPVLNKSQYVFIFTDNGIGMSDEFLPHIFEPFSRAEDSRISKIQGTGLGMAITENIVRMMNGTIEVESRSGEGSRFTVSIPLDFAAEEEQCNQELEGLPVLVVDDDPVTCENAAALLNELGMRGSWVTSGAEAVLRISEAHAQSEDFFAVILDWKMPEMDGLETLKAIRRKLGKGVPIIIISAYDYSDIEKEFLQAGADAFLNKPLFKSKMLHVLQLFCSVNKEDPAAAVTNVKYTALAQKRVLLAEDNDLNREIAAELLEMQEIFVDTAENGKQALELFAASAPDTYAAILMDIQMPDMNGYEATAAIRALNRRDAQTVPILALTANVFAADMGKARSVGMNDHIAKPIEIDRMMETLQKWVK